MAFQGFALFALGALSLAGLLYYMYANNTTQEQPYGSEHFVSPNIDTWNEGISTNSRRTSNNGESSNRRKRQSKQSRSSQSLEAVCTICLRKIKNEGKILPCNHQFHDACIEDWKSQGPIDTRYTCPNCRKSYAT